MNEAQESGKITTVSVSSSVSSKIAYIAKALGKDRMKTMEMLIDPIFEVVSNFAPNGKANLEIYTSIKDSRILFFVRGSSRVLIVGKGSEEDFMKALERHFFDSEPNPKEKAK